MYCTCNQIMVIISTYLNTSEIEQEYFLNVLYIFSIINIFPFFFRNFEMANESHA